MGRLMRGVIGGGFGRLVIALFVSRFERWWMKRLVGRSLNLRRCRRDLCPLFYFGNTWLSAGSPRRGTLYPLGVASFFFFWRCGVNAAVKQSAHDALDGFFAAPTCEPLIFEPVGDGVMVSRGIPKTRMTISEAALFLGMDRKTLRNNYIKRRKLNIGTDKKISRKAVLTLFNSLDGRD